MRMKRMKLGRYIVRPNWEDVIISRGNYVIILNTHHIGFPILDCSIFPKRKKITQNLKANYSQYHNTKRTIIIKETTALKLNFVNKSKKIPNLEKMNVEMRLSWERNMSKTSPTLTKCMLFMVCAQSVLIRKKSPKHAYFCQIWSN